MFENIDIIRIYKGKKTNLEDIVAQEIPFTINVHNQELVTLMASPSDLKDLVVGFLYSSGLIKRFSDIENVILDRQHWTASVELKDKQINKNLIFKRLFTSGCGRGIIFYNAIDLMHRKKIQSDFVIEESKIFEFMHRFQKESAGFRKTGGTHSAQIYNKDDVRIFREDIGRHNAIDKVIGAGLRQNLDFHNSLILSSGRISSEIIFKIKKVDVPVVVSQSAPTDQAIKLARELNLTLIGFVRGKRMNIYSAETRLR